MKSKKEIENKLIEINFKKSNIKGYLTDDNYEYIEGFEIALEWVIEK
jgi:hypothetical protein